MCPLALCTRPNESKGPYNFLSWKRILVLQFVFELSQKPHNYARFTHKRADMRPCQRQQLVQSFYLQQQLDSLNGSDSCFGDGSGDATGQKVFHKTNHRVRHDWLFLVEIRDFWLFQRWPRSSRKPYASPSGRGTPMCLNIWGPIIARILSDGFAVCRTDKRGWINFRGQSSTRAPCFWSQESAYPGTFKGHNVCNLIIIKSQMSLILMMEKSFI